MKKTAFSLAAILFLTTLLTACGSGDTVDTTDPTGDTTAPDTTAEPCEFEPADADYKGATFTIAENEIGDWMQSAFIEEQNGEVLNDSIYERNRIVEELYNIDIVGYKIEGGRNSQQLTQITNGILAGDKEYDIAYIPGQLSSILFNNPDYLIPLSDVATLDLSHSWWDAESVKAMTIKGRTISATGEMIVSTTGASTITFFNKKLADDFDMDVYQIVRDGDFTFTKMYELGKQVQHDVNGDSTFHPDNDRYGVCVESLNLPQLIIASGEHLVKTNKDGDLEFSLGTERVANIVQEFIRIIDDMDSVISAQDNRNTVKLPDIYNENRLMFWVTNLQRMNAARSYEAEFGLIPFPKYEESDDYGNPINEYWSSWLVIPATHDDTDFVGTVCEALGYYSQVHVTPAFIENAVTTKGLRDDESAEMLEMVLPKKVFDIGNYFDWGYWMLYRMTQNHSANIASELATNRPNIEAAIQKFMDAYVK